MRTESAFLSGGGGTAVSRSPSCFWVTWHVCGEMWCGEECLKAGLCQALLLGNMEGIALLPVL